MDRCCGITVLIIVVILCMPGLCMGQTPASFSQVFNFSKTWQGTQISKTDLVQLLQTVRGLPTPAVPTPVPEATVQATVKAAQCGAVTLSTGSALIVPPGLLNTDAGVTLTQYVVNSAQAQRGLGGCMEVEVTAVGRSQRDGVTAGSQALLELRIALSRSFTPGQQLDLDEVRYTANEGYDTSGLGNLPMRIPVGQATVDSSGRVAVAQVGTLHARYVVEEVFADQVARRVAGGAAQPFAATSEGPSPVNFDG